MAETARITAEVAGGTAAIAADRKQFKTGSRGFHGQGKVPGPGGRRFQVTVNIAEIWSQGKPAS